MAKKKVERHRLARTTVDVYRLFKVISLSRALTASNDYVIKDLGQQINNEARKMAETYSQEQQSIINKEEASKVYKSPLAKTIRRHSKGKP